MKRKELKALLASIDEAVAYITDRMEHASDSWLNGEVGCRYELARDRLEEASAALDEVLDKG